MRAMAALAQRDRWQASGLLPLTRGMRPLEFITPARDPALRGYQIRRVPGIVFQSAP